MGIFIWFLDFILNLQKSRNSGSFIDYDVLRPKGDKLQTSIYMLENIEKTDLRIWLAVISSFGPSKI